MADDNEMISQLSNNLKELQNLLSNCNDEQRVKNTIKYIDYMMLSTNLQSMNFHIELVCEELFHIINGTEPVKTYGMT